MQILKRDIGKGKVADVQERQVCVTYMIETIQSFLLNIASSAACRVWLNHLASYWLASCGKLDLFILSNEVHHSKPHARPSIVLARGQM